MSGSKYLCDLPDGYDEESRLVCAGWLFRKIMLVHPKMPPLILEYDDVLDNGEAVNPRWVDLFS